MKLMWFTVVVFFASCLFVAAAGANPSDFSVNPVVAPFKLSEARGKYVVLHFLLKTECPYCLRHVNAYASRGAKELPGDVVQVFLKPDTEEEIGAWAGKLAPVDGERPVIYRDPGAKLADAFGIPGGYKFHGQVVHYPALVLIGPDGKEVFRYVGKDNSDRYPFEKLKATLGEVRLKGAPATQPAASGR